MEDSQALSRARWLDTRQILIKSSFYIITLLGRVLRENGKYLPKQSFFMRKHYFNDEEAGVLKVNNIHFLTIMLVA